MNREDIWKLETEGPLRTQIEDRIAKLKKEESDFKTKWWSDCNVRYVSMGETKHVSEVKYTELRNFEIIAFLEYLIRQQENIFMNRTFNLIEQVKRDMQVKRENERKEE